MEVLVHVDEFLYTMVVRVLLGPGETRVSKWVRHHFPGIL